MNPERLPPRPCHACGYDLRATRSVACVECGAEALPPWGRPEESGPGKCAMASAWIAGGGVLGWIGLVVLFLAHGDSVGLVGLFLIVGCATTVLPTLGVVLGVVALRSRRQRLAAVGWVVNVLLLRER